MHTLRTPDERFADLPDYPFAPNYVDVDDQDGGSLRVHYLDEGPADGPVVLAMHGEPSWSYLYRKIIPLLVAGGARVIAPDLVGFGKSDKPTEKSDYTYERHVAWMQAAIIDHLDLTDATFFGQDWGGLVGLRLVAENPDRFARVVIGNTGLPTGEGSPSQAFLDWQKFSQESPVFPIGQILNGATITELTDAEIAAYDAPFPDETYKEGARIFPSLVPTSTDDPAADANRAAWEVFRAWTKPFVCCFSDSDPITGGGDKIFLKLVPGTEGQPHTTITNAHHFFQEDGAPQIAEVILDAIARG
ncbi:haloalkane dehalogenase [Ilumatobacter coccineus]|uniref:Haloalkane dehalogenase n=1 Tax=Ilumatobacter coccineus (strain NBRC 103263 / KCTC 29153 / YM16-304) TaxID=1313172 RepID=A0A6C7EBT1_ILUCY|nr:haloalkane dehalogenase [Ilumatobacter coccineus]BAN03452.1 haloalkane dehalogenase [Ilumatobacter coccineus YM16-304]